MTPEELQQVRYRARSLSGWRERLKLPLRWLEDIDVALEATNAIDALDGARRDAEARVKELHAEAAGTQTLLDTAKAELAELRERHRTEVQTLTEDLNLRRAAHTMQVDEMTKEHARVEVALDAVKHEHAAFLARVGVAR